MKITNKTRYIYDALYGPIYLPDFIWDIITSPELQRLREVRLCNINSLSLTGGANINRYEHALGTFFLANECLNARPVLNPISETEQESLLLAALLHDIASSAFGHSVEYIESMHGFDHEKAFEYVALGKKGDNYSYKLSTLEPIFFGLPRELMKKIPAENLELIGKIIAGNNRLGKLLNNCMDLDNIDNVFRMGYHIGIVKSGEIPLKLARSLYLQGDELILRKEATPYVKEWYRVRRNLYLLLLLNPEEFSGKCMLTEAIELSKTIKNASFTWHDVDFELLEKLKVNSSESASLISRLMKGDLYGCIAIFATGKTDKYNLFRNIDTKRALEDKLSTKIRESFKPALRSALIGLHPILDSNKTQRAISIKTDDGSIAQVGKSTNQLLIGVFFKNVDLNAQKIRFMPNHLNDRVKWVIRDCLRYELDDQLIEEKELYGELKELE